MFITSPNLHFTSSPINIVHGFFKGTNSTSTQEQSTLNCSFGKQDDRNVILKNRECIKNSLLNHYQIDNSVSLLFTQQQHTSNAIDITNTTVDPIIGDAMVTTLPNILLGIQTADCMPILFCDPKNKVIGAAHAGWRGLSKGIIENTISLLITKGAELSCIYACIGPSIDAHSYEVDQEIRDIFCDYPNAFSIRLGENQTKYTFNSKTVAIEIFKKLGIHHYNSIAIDTYTNHAFFSYRRSSHLGLPHLGNQASIIGMIDR